MQLRTIFKKPIDRPIEGVIKVDDDRRLRFVVDEYVLTREIEEHLEAFLDAYNSPEGANGAWISGFFGSGKSHFLKILSLLLGPPQMDGLAVADAFMEKANGNNNLKAAIAKASEIPSESILFNIDQQADVISNTDVDALLTAFVKVFDESCGYCGRHGYIANFERQLDDDNLLGAFKTAFGTLVPNGWEWVRCGRIHRFATQIDQAYEMATGQVVDGIIDRYRGDYKLSIGDFAGQVNSYIERQDSNNFRLSFLVDEVGQYIADSTKLMTNLQTVTESLATKTRGRAWVIVTAQEDLDSVAGQMRGQQHHDSSKIQARFASRMKLTSRDVSEVIQKRLLAKTDDGRQTLESLYASEVNNFTTLFGFSDGSIEYRTYNDQQHFVNSYPFVPYQFDLFQLAIQSLSRHNAFPGTFGSVGERSMLGVFQQVAVHIADRIVGEFATFDLMYEGIRAALTSHSRSPVLRAERDLTDPLAIRLLKALFLLKYVREFKATARNLCVLVLERIDQDLCRLETSVQEALNTLESQVYVQRHGEVYEILTDEEKEIEQEIKNTEVEMREVADQLSKLVFQSILKAKTIRPKNTKRDYAFTRKMDDRVTGRVHELSVNVISPFHDDNERIERLRVRETGEPELLVVLPGDERVMRDMILFRQTEKYVRQNVTKVQSESITRILSEKNSANQERLRSIHDDLKVQLGRARMFVAAEEVESCCHDPVSRIEDGFNELVGRTYTCLGMLQGITYSESGIAKYLAKTYDESSAADESTLSEAETEMLAHIGRSTNKGLRTTVQQVVEAFETRPFGWPRAAILCTLSTLCRRGSIVARSDSEPMEGVALVTAFMDTHAHMNIFLEQQFEYTSNQIRRVKEFYRDFFDRPALATEAKPLGEEVALGFQGLDKEIAQLHSQASDFPFLANLTDLARRVRGLAWKPYQHFFAEFEAERDVLLDLKEDVLDPMRRFISGPNAILFREAIEFLDHNEANLTYLDGKGAETLRAMLSDEKIVAGHRMRNVKSQLDSLNQQVASRLRIYRAEAAEQIRQKARRIRSTPHFATLDEQQRGEFTAAIEGTLTSIESNTSIAYVKDTPSRFATGGYADLLQKVGIWLNCPAGANGNSEAPPDYVAASQLTVDFDQAWLSKESDVDSYLKALRNAMIKEISKGNRLQL